MVDIQDKIKEQGDLVRKLKAEKAAKDQVRTPVLQLIFRQSGQHNVLSARLQTCRCFESRQGCFTVIFCGNVI
jgi:hypothetical protein